MIQYILSWIGVAFGLYAFIVGVMASSVSDEELSDFRKTIVRCLMIASALLVILGGIQVYPD